MSPLTDNILLKVCSKIMDEVTTTDELIPSGETSSYRSNPLGLAEFTLSRRDPEYVGKSKAACSLFSCRTNTRLYSIDHASDLCFHFIYIFLTGNGMDGIKYPIQVCMLQI